MDENTYTDEHTGEVWRKHTFDYQLNGSTFSFSAFARSRAEAEGPLLEAIRNATYGYGPSK